VCLLLGGCATAPPVASVPTSAATGVPGVAALGAGFLGDVTAPTPEATVNPEPGSWDGVEPPVGYRVVLISAGDDSGTATLAGAVQDWAARSGVQLERLTASTDDEVEAQINTAVLRDADLVIGAGNAVVDVFALLTPQHLAQQFLVVGAELPEPTENLTAVVWEGATFRGTGLSAASDYDETTITAGRADDAVTAGVASVLHGHTGIVLRLTF